MNFRLRLRLQLHPARFALPNSMDQRDREQQVPQAHSAQTADWTVPSFGAGQRC